MAELPVASTSRRELLKKMGWVLPAVLVVSIPKNAFAQYAPPTKGGGGGGVITIQ